MKVCEICGDEYAENRSNQRYCKVCGKNSAKARAKYKRAEFINKIHAGDLHKPKEITCLECGKKLLTTYIRSFCSTVCTEGYRIRKAKCPICKTLLTEKGNHSGRGCCSDECREKHKLQKAIEKGNYIPCEYCGEKFIKKRHDNWFCSSECSRKSKTEENQKKVEASQSQEKAARVAERKCEGCGEPFTWRIERATQRFCSEKCQKEKAKEKKRKSIEKLNLGKDLNICTICKTAQMDCDRFTSGFVYRPKGARTEKINDRFVIVSCPQYKR